MTEREPLRRVLTKVTTGADAGVGDAAAAARIADAAWRRAEELRAAPPRAVRLVSRRVLVPVAAAAAVLAAVVLLVRPTVPAFAVEGGAVQLQRGAAWRPATSVPLATWVFAPPGTRTTLRAADGAVIEPGAGAVFRILGGDGAPGVAWTVDLRRGDAEVAGRSIVLTLADRMEVGRSADADFLRVAVSLGAALDAAPADAASSAGDGAPTVRVLEGAARVLAPRTDETMLLRAHEAATTLTIRRGGAVATRLLREVQWSPGVATELGLGAEVMGAAEGRGGAFSIAIALPGEGPLAVSVPEDLRREVLDQIGLLSAHVAARRIEVSAIAPASPVVADFLAVRRDGRRTKIVLFEDGGVRLHRSGRAPRRFASLDELRREAPDAAAPFGDRLRR